MYRPRTAIIPGLGTVTPAGDITAAEWGNAKSDIAVAYDEAQLSQTRVYDTRAYASHQDAIEAAYADGGGEVFFATEPPSGTALTLRDGVYLRGRGKGTTVWTADSITGSGAITPLPTINSATIYDRTITFVSAPSVLPGDVILIHDETPSGWNPARTYYHSGEYVVVKSVSGNTVTLTAALYDSYTASASLKVYRLDPIHTGVSDMTIRGTLGKSLIRVKHGRNLTFRNLDLGGTDITCLSIDKSFGFEINGVVANDTSTEGGTNYGVTIANSQNGDVIGCLLESSRHGLTTGGDAQPGCVSCRDLRRTGGRISGHATGAGTTGLGLHGNSEYITLTGVSLPAGITLAGDNITLTGCTILSSPWGTAVHMVEARGSNMSLQSCIIRATRTIDSDHGLIHVRVDGNTIRPGVWRMSGCFVDIRGYGWSSGTDGTSAVHVLGHANAIFTGNIVDIQGTTFRTTLTTTPTSYFAVRSANAAASPVYSYIRYRNNANPGMRVFATAGLTAQGIDFNGEGTGAPAFIATKGSRYLRTDGGAGTTMYINETGTSTWRAV